MNFISAAVAKYPKANLGKQRVVIITNSEQPVTIAICKQVSDHQEVSTFSVNVKPVAQELLLDSNGAGDTFVGGFLAKASLILQNKQYLNLSQEEINMCVQAGNLMASEVIQLYGCDFPELETIKDKIE